MAEKQQQIGAATASRWQIPRNRWLLLLWVTALSTPKEPVTIALSVTAPSTQEESPRFFLTPCEFFSWANIGRSIEVFLKFWTDKIYVKVVYLGVALPLPFYKKTTEYNDESQKRSHIELNQKRSSEERSSHGHKSQTWVIVFRSRWLPWRKPGRKLLDFMTLRNPKVCLAYRSLSVFGLAET